MPLVTFTDQGLYCSQADLYIDPWRPVHRAIITHAHADHSRYGMKHYLAHHKSIPVMRHRLGDINVQGHEYGETIQINGVHISLHPAGHIPGSAQVRLEYKGEVWVVSGDYKLEDDGVCEPFESVACQHFVTESTFGLPVYRWQPQAVVMEQINAWWAENAADNHCSVVSCYALGKAQRVLKYLDANQGPIYVHGAIANSNEALEQSGLFFPDVKRLEPNASKESLRKAIVLAPPSALGSPWMKKLMPYRVASASGWMSIRGAKRRRNVDRGFILSDHADWIGLNEAVHASGAEHIYVTHGYSTVFSKWLQSQGLHAQVVQTAYEGELAEIGEGSQKEGEAEA